MRVLLVLAVVVMSAGCKMDTFERREGVLKSCTAGSGMENVPTHLDIFDETVPGNILRSASLSMRFGQADGAWMTLDGDVTKSNEALTFRSQVSDLTTDLNLVRGNKDGAYQGTFRAHTSTSDTTCDVSYGAADEPAP